MNTEETKVEEKKPEEEQQSSEKVKPKPKHPPGVGSWTGFDFHDQE